MQQKKRFFGACRRTDDTLYKYVVAIDLTPGEASWFAQVYCEDELRGSFSDAIGVAFTSSLLEDTVRYIVEKGSWTGSGFGFD